MKAARKRYRRFPPRAQRTLREGPRQPLRLTLTDMAHQGEALGRADGKVVFAAYGLPGEEVVVEVREEKPSYAIAEVVQVLVPSEHRVEPRCPHFGVCGGCQLQHVDYPYQLELKRRVVQEQLRRIGKLVDAPVSPTVGARDPWHYRNHARFTVARGGAIGFTHWHTHRFVPVEWCYIMDPWINQAKAALEDRRGTDGSPRQLTIRRGVNTGSYLVHPSLEGPGGARPVMASGEALETAQPWHEETLFDVRFRVSAASFFQTNTRQAERMAALVRDRLGLKGTGTLLDAYAGVGTFAALFAPFAGRVVAIEESAAAVRDARENLRGLGNVEITEGKTEELLADLPFHPDVIILDPPRAGCDPRVVAALGRLLPERIVYVSCEPATLARDLQGMVLQGFVLTDVTPVDMFPQTYHIECVATLERAGPGAIVLASTSPSRRELVRRLGVPVQAVAPVSAEEAPAAGAVVTPASAADHALALARAKALSLADRSRLAVLGADTIVVLDGSILGKPAGAQEARAMLRALRGREHAVVTGVAVAEPGGAALHAEALETRVRMRGYSDQEIEAYVASGDPLDKAGAYAVQDETFRPADVVDGCYLNVVGLPLCLADRLLRRAGVPLPKEGVPPLPPRCVYCAPETRRPESSGEGRQS